jgi:imidazolonepropionase-like amidohydrolase
VLAGSRSLFVQMGAQGASVAGGTRAAEYMLLEQAIREARAAGPAAPGALLHAAGKETLARYLAGGRVVFQVDRAADILEVVEFAQRSGMKPVILGGDEAWLVAKDLAKAHVPVILDPLDDLPADYDRLASSLENAARLHNAGVRIAFSSGDTPQARLTRQLAGNAVAHGLPWDAALAAITSTPAEIFGLATRGRIAVGQVADLVLWSGDPLEVSTLADQVWIAGRPIDMKSRQTELRDRYAEKVKAHQAR